MKARIMTKLLHISLLLLGSIYPTLRKAVILSFETSSEAVRKTEFIIMKSSLRWKTMVSLMFINALDGELLNLNLHNHQ